MKLSICIPTYNRARLLRNCLNSIEISKKNSNLEFEVCISDNNSSDATTDVVLETSSKLNVKYHKNNENIGIPRNFLNVVSMAEGEYVWLIGDDDLLMPYALKIIENLTSNYSSIDFFYVNSFFLDTSYLNAYPHPFDTTNLPVGMRPFSKKKNSVELSFFELIDPMISFDFLGGMFLSVFRRQKWNENINELDEIAINDKRVFSHFDNTFPHIKIFAKAFSDSKVFFNHEPLSVSLSGAREWAPMNPLVMSIRLVEALYVYKSNGLSLWKFIYCKNYALRNFMSDYINLILYRDKSGYEYINPFKVILSNLLYPNFYLSPLSFFGRQILKIYNKLCGAPTKENG